MTRQQRNTVAIEICQPKNLTIEDVKANGGVIHHGIPNKRSTKRIVLHPLFSPKDELNLDSNQRYPLGAKDWNPNLYRITKKRITKHNIHSKTFVDFSSY